MKIDKEIFDLIKSKANLVIRGYPTFGIKTKDLIEITIELCQDEKLNPESKIVKYVIIKSGFNKVGHRYFPNVPQNLNFVREKTSEISPEPLSSEIRMEIPFSEINGLERLL